MGSRLRELPPPRPGVAGCGGAWRSVAPARVRTTAVAPGGGGGGSVATGVLGSGRARSCSLFPEGVSRRSVVGGWGVVMGGWGVVMGGWGVVMGGPCERRPGT